MTTKPLTNLESLQFDNCFTRCLPGDPVPDNTRRQVTQACYSRVLPTKVARPELVAYSREVAELLDLDMREVDLEDFAQVFAGNRLVEGMDPFAMCYGGHQFGNWAGQLGDGRAINLGEVVNGRGERWILQLKGAGPTPYSRTADGLAVLRSSVREFLCSEAMYHLAVPTTRALSLVLTGEEVLRDMFYDGNPQYELGAVVCRVARSFTRFGNFQLFTWRRDLDTLRQLVDYTIRTDFSHLGEPSQETYAAWFDEICRTTAEMLVHWMRVGFVHGVMNTDNMSVLGQTIDYGPYGWLEDFHPSRTPNTTDAAGRRYCFGNQPQIAMWNLAQFGNALVPLFDDTQPLQTAMESYSREFEHGWQTMMAAKLGWQTYVPETDEPLTKDLFELLQLTETDMTIFFRRLAQIDVTGASTPDELFEPLREAYYVPEQLNDDLRSRIHDWLQRYVSRCQQDGTPGEERRARMNAVNPKYVLRNYLAQLAIDKSDQGDYSLINELLELLRRPYDEQPEHEQYAAKRPDWARHRAGCSMLSCSS